MSRYFYLLLLIQLCAIYPNFVESNIQPSKQMESLAGLSAQQIDKDALVKKLKAIMEELKVVGLSAAIVDKTGIIWEGDFGLASIEGKKPMTVNSLYRIASVSKTIMATALMQQYELGKFRLTDDISDYLGYKVRNPKYPDIPINFIHLMTHTSSLQDDYVDFVKASYTENPPNLSEALVPGGKYYKASIWGNYKPGDMTNFHYSNLASLVVGTLVEVFSGERYDQYCRKHIFLPLGMNGTSLYVEDLDASNIAVLYSYDAKTDTYNVELDSAGRDRPRKVDFSNYKPGTNGGIFSPQGGVRSSATELSKFLLAHMNGGSWNGQRILKPETVQLMHVEHWCGIPPDTNYRKKGLQFQITSSLLGGKVLIGHGGNAYGMISGLYFDEKLKRGIVFMTSGSNLDLSQQTYTIERKLTEALFNAK